MTAISNKWKHSCFSRYFGSYLGLREQRHAPVVTMKSLWYQRPKTNWRSWDFVFQKLDEMSLNTLYTQTYTYTHIYIYTYTYIHTYTYICIYSHTCIQTHILLYTHICTAIHARICVYLYIHTQIYTYKPIHTLIYVNLIHMYVCMYINVCFDRI